MFSPLGPVFPVFAALLRVLGLGILLWLPGASLAADTDFLQGKKLTHIVGTKPGGGYDTYARLIAKYLENRFSPRWNSAGIMFLQSLASLSDLLSSPALLALIVLIVLAVPIGMFFGAMPGLGGKLGIALLIPLVFGMEPVAGAVLLVAMHGVVHTGGSIPSILLGIPGTGPDAATVVDGYPLTQQGQAGRALGAMLGASAIGGVIGALALGAMLPLLKPVIFCFRAG